MERCSVWRWMGIGEEDYSVYEGLKRFHYRGGRPGVVARVFGARYWGPGLGGRYAREGMVAGVAVECFPPLACRLRDVALPGVFELADRGEAAGKLNREMRTISRVVVHPMFRSCGLAVGLVRHVLAHADTPYVEALAAMGRVHPFFERAGMRRFDLAGDGVRVSAPVYFLWENRNPKLENRNANGS